jgi:hypothetical protein
MAGAVACRIVGVRLLVTAEVVAALGGPAQARAELGRTRGSSYRCTECGQRGRFADEPAAVVVRLLDRGGAVTRVVSFAHPGCCGSRVESAAPGVRPGMPAVHAAGWVEADRPGLRAVLLLATRASETAHTGHGDTVELLLAALHGDGFVTVTDLATPLPVVPGVRVYGSGERLVVRVGGLDLYDGPPPLAPDWAATAEADGRLRVLVASGVDVRDPEKDVFAEVFTALGKGLVVAALARYTPRLPQPPPRWRSGRQRRRGGRRG